MTPLRALATWSLALALILPGCAARHEPPPPPAVAPVAAALSPAPADPSLPVAGRALRISVDISMEVADIEAAKGAVRAAVARAGGYIGEAQTSGGEDARVASFEVHIPVPNLATFRAEIAKLGETKGETEKAEDVTEQRADLRARLANARAGERRLLNLLEQRTGSLANVVLVEKELGTTREAIERMEAQERALEGQIQNATVKIQLAARHAGDAAGAGHRLAQAVRDGFDNAGAFLVGAGILLASTGPTLGILVIAGYGVYWVVRVWRGRRRAKR